MLKISTQEQLIEFLKNYKSGTPVKLVTKTQVKMNVKDVATKSIKNPNGVVYKVSVLEAEINFDYEEKVNDQRLVEGKQQDFQAANSRWGVWVSKSLSENGGKYYLKTIPKKSIYKPTYEDSFGNPVDYSVIEPFIPVKKESVNEENRQGTDKEVVFRAYKLDSIAHLSIEGVLSYIAE